MIDRQRSAGCKGARPGVQRGALLLVFVMLLTAGAVPEAPRQEDGGRSARWKEVRHTKVEHLEAPEMGVVEWTVFQIEQSIESGLLGRTVLGVPVYQGLLGLLLLALLTACLRGLYRLLARFRTQ